MKMKYLDKYGCIPSSNSLRTFLYIPSKIYILMQCTRNQI